MVNIIVEPIRVGKQTATGIKMEWPFGWFLIIIGNKAVLTCGAFDHETFKTFSIPMSRAVGTPKAPLKTFDDVLSAKITDVTPEAAELGIKIGIVGKEALEKCF